MRAAAPAWFGRGAATLDASEAALLVQAIHAPAQLDPVRDPARAEARRITVLRNMERGGLLSPRAAAAAMATRPILLDPPGRCGPD